MRSLIPSMAAILLMVLPLCSCRPLSVDKTNEPFLIRLKGIDLIEGTCKSTPNYELCVSTLQSDPRSFDAAIDTLGLIVVDAVKAKATATVETIKKLRMSSNPEDSVPLFECSIRYNAILKADIPEAIEALTKGVPKFAEDGMADTAVEAQVCENSFEGSNSPLTDMNKAVYDLSLVARSIIRMLL